MLEDFNHALTGGRTRKRYCGFTKWAQTLTAEDRDIANELMDNRHYGTRELTDYFNAKGGGFSYQVVTRHRNNYCCGKTAES